MAGRIKIYDLRERNRKMQILDDAFQSDERLKNYIKNFNKDGFQIVVEYYPSHFTYRNENYFKGRKVNEGDTKKADPKNGEKGKERPGRAYLDSETVGQCRHMLRSRTSLLPKDVPIRYSDH